MTDELRDLLHAAVPEPPAAPDRATGARERHRRQRRRRTYAAATVAATVVAVLAAVPALLSGDDSTPSPAPPVPSEGCPAPDTPADGADRLPDDPVSIRLCPGTAVAFDAPEDALVGAAAQTVVALANTQATAADTAACDDGNAYLLRFLYPDGHAQVVTVAPGCGHLRIGSTLHEDGDAALAKFLQELHEQRRATDPPDGLAVRPGCDVGPEETSPLGGHPVALATLCTARSSVPVTERELRVLQDDVRPEGSGPPIPPELVGVAMVGSTEWGDLERFTVGTDWWPGPEARRVLDRLVDAAGDPELRTDASATPEEVVAAFVGLLNVDDSAHAMALWMSQVRMTEPPTVYAYGAEVLDVRPLPTVSAWPDATAVTTRWRQAWEGRVDIEERRVVFMLGRDENGAFRIVSMGR